MFVFGHTDKADEAEREGKATSAKSYKGALLSVGSDMGGRKKDTVLTTDKISSSSSNRVEDRWYWKSRKEGHILATTTSKRVTKVIEGQRDIGSSYGTLYSKYPSIGRLGLGNKYHKKPKLTLSGQAQNLL